MDSLINLQSKNDDLILFFKKCLFLKNKNIFEIINFHHSYLYDEPFLYTYSNHFNEVYLDSIILKFDPIITKNVVQLFSDKNGKIYVPNFGYFITSHKAKELEYFPKTNKLMYKQKNVIYKFRPIIYLYGGFELVTAYHPIVDLVIKNELNIKKPIDVLYDSDLLFKLNSALELIEKIHNKLFIIFKYKLKKILLFSAEEPYSFASIKIHNMIFIKTKPSDSIIFFIEHLVHEGSHVIFNTLTFEDKLKLFKVPFNESFSKVTGNEWEHGNLYSRFHGLYTLEKMSIILVKCYKSNLFNGDDLEEVKGRLYFTLKRFEFQLESFNNIYDSIDLMGIQWLNAFNNTFEELRHYIKYFRNKKYDILKQSYDFNFETYKASNKSLFN